MSAATSFFQAWGTFRRRRKVRLQPVATSPALAFHRALPWLLAALALTMLPLLAQGKLQWALLVFGACTLWRYWLERTDRPLPSLLGRLVIFMPVAYLVMSSYNSKDGATGMLAFLIALLSLKILELRTARDFMVASLLGFFMVLANLFYDQSLNLCAYLGFTVLLQLAALMHCHGGLQRLGATLRLSLGMSVQALPLVVLLFLVFPRVQGSFLHRFSGGNNGRTGMSDHLQPGSFSSLAQSTDPVFRAKLTAPGGKPITQGRLYWRGAVLDVCDDPLVWRAREHQSIDLPGQKDGIRQDITLFWSNLTWLYALDRPTSFRPSLPTDLKAQYLTTGILRSEPVYKTVLYTVYSSTGDADFSSMNDEQRQRYAEEQRRPNVVLPRDIGPRSRELAQSWRKNARSDEDVLRAASDFFGNNHFVYTLTPGLLPSKGALDAFLFESRRGFCEHFAAAYCTLLRAAGVPARVVVGYQGGEFNGWGRNGGYYLIRQSDAHAWAEVFLPDRGWVREDPTALVAPDRVSYGADGYAAREGLGGSLHLGQFDAPGSLRWALRNASQIWDSMDEQWNQAVLGYNQDTQLSLLERLGLDKLNLLKGTALTLALAFAILSAGGLLIYLFERATGRRADPVQRLYQKFCARIAKLSGVTRQPVEGPLDFARRATAALPAAAPTIQRITDLYVASRYARDGSKSLLEELRRAVRRFAAGASAR